MTEFELVKRFQKIEGWLKNEGYSVSVIQSGFYIHNSKGTIVGDTQTVDGLTGFLQGVQWSNREVEK